MESLVDGYRGPVSLTEFKLHSVGPCYFFGRFGVRVLGDGVAIKAVEQGITSGRRNNIWEERFANWPGYRLYIRLPITEWWSCCTIYYCYGKNS